MATPNLALEEFSKRIRRLNRDQLLSLPPEELARIDYLLQDVEHDQIDARCGQRVASEEAGPLYWAQNLTNTVDDQASQKGLQAYRRLPKKSYFIPLFEALLTEKRLLICKSREMLTSWSICIFVAWLCAWNPGTTAVIQTMKEEKAGELIRYIAVLLEQQEAFLRKRHPVASSNRLSIHWENGSRVFGIPGGEHQIRMYHPGVAVFDEIGAMVDAEQCWNAAHPVSVQMIGVSSARPGWFGDECSA